MSDSGAFTSSVPIGDLSPAQRAALADGMAAEGIAGSWAGDVLHVDSALEARVESLVQQARSVPDAAGPPPGYAPASGAPPAPPVAYPPAGAPAYPPAGGYGYPPAGAPAYGPGQTYGYGYAPAAYGYYAPVNNSNATVALIAGIVGLAVCPIVPSIIAIIFGKRAQDEIAASAGTQTGEGMAKIGVILGWVGLGLYGLFIIGYILFFVLIIGLSAV